VIVNSFVRCHESKPIARSPRVEATAAIHDARNEALAILKRLDPLVENLVLDNPAGSGQPGIPLPAPASGTNTRLPPMRRSSGLGRRPTPPGPTSKSLTPHDFAVALATKRLTLTTFRLTATTFALLPRFYFERHVSRADADNFPSAVTIQPSSDNFNRHRANYTTAIAISSALCRFSTQISKLSTKRRRLPQIKSIRWFRAAICFSLVCWFVAHSKSPYRSAAESSGGGMPELQEVHLPESREARTTAQKPASSGDEKGSRDPSLYVGVW